MSTLLLKQMKMHYTQANMILHVQANLHLFEKCSLIIRKSSQNTINEKHKSLPCLILQNDEYFNFKKVKSYAH